MPMGFGTGIQLGWCLVRSHVELPVSRCSGSCLCLSPLQRSDPQLLAQFYYADEELNQVAAELDSLDGRKDPQRCTLLVSQFRSCQVSARRAKSLSWGNLLPPVSTSQVAWVRCWAPLTPAAHPAGRRDDSELNRVGKRARQGQPGAGRVLARELLTWEGGARQ